jgi:hypothetical protein
LTAPAQGGILHVEVHMELTRRTTILLPEDLYRHLVRLAKRRGSSMGELIRAACLQQYGLVSVEDRQQAVDELASLSLPVGTPEEMAAESVPDPLHDVP